MILFILIVAIFFSVAFPKSKIITLLWGCLLIINVVCTTQSLDALFLEYRYSQKGFDGFPVLFRKLMGACAQYNLSFLQFKFIYVCIIVVLLFLTIRYLTEQRAFCMMLITIYPGWCFSGQIRNTLGAVLVIFALAFLIKSSFRYKKIVYIACVVIATLVHPSCILYLLVIFCLKDNVSMSRKFIVFYLAVIVLLYSNGIYRIVSLFLHNERVLQYLRVSLTKNIFASLVVILGQLILTFVIVRQLKMDETTNYWDEADSRQEVYDLMIKVNYAFLILIPFYGINHAAFRIYKYLFITNYCVLSSECYGGRLLRMKNVMLLIAIAFISLMLQVTVDGGIGDVFTLFNNLDFTQLRMVFN